MSETDAAIELLFAGKTGVITKETILKATGNPETVEIEEGDTTFFFSHLWPTGGSGPEHAPAVPLQNLRQLLEQNLTGL